MQYQFVGARSGVFTADNGKDISYGKMLVKFPFDIHHGFDEIQGSNWDVLKVPYDTFPKLVEGLNSGDFIDVQFDRHGRVETVNLIEFAET